jgi:hypothetical protein
MNQQQIDHMITLDDIRVDGTDHTFSLVKLVGKPIKDIVGYLSGELGGATFNLTEVIFEDGTTLGVEGGHYFPYLVEFGTTPQPNFDEETLERLLEEDE